MLDREGVIVTVNDAWRRFSAENGGAAAGTYVGANYLSVCAVADAAGGEGAGAVLEGVREVLAGGRESFSAEYPCHSPEEERWFMLCATPLPGGGAVLSHTVITDRKRAEAELARRARQGALGADGGVALARAGRRCARPTALRRGRRRHLDAASRASGRWRRGDVLSAGQRRHVHAPRRAHGRVPSAS